MNVTSFVNGLKRYGLAAVCFVLWTGTCAQASVKEDIKTAFEAGSAREVVKFCMSKVELTFSGDKTTCAKKEAEKLLADFFTANPVTAFEYVHQGSSNEGLKYMIGRCVSDQRKFRVYILMSPVNGKYMIRSMNFTAE